MKAIFLVMLILVGNSYAGSSLDIAGYLSQVEKNHSGYRAAKQAAEAARSRVSEESLVTAPVLKAEYQTGVDEKPSVNPTAYGTKSSQSLWSVGVVQQTTFGLQGKLSYTNVYRSTEGASPAFLPIPKYYMGSPSLELSQSLLRNGFGSETRATKDIMKASAEASRYTEQFKARAALVEAEAGFWRLWSARKSVESLRQGLEVSEKFKAWAERRMVNQLGDQAEVIQAKAAVEGRRLELTLAIAEEQSAARNFNSLRGVAGSQVEEALIEGDAKLGTLPVQFESRDDLRAMQAGARAASANALTGYERNRPQLDVYGLYSWNSLDPDSSKASSDSLKSDHPAWAAGIRFSTPLYFGTASDARDAYQAEAAAAELAVSRKAEDAERDWKDAVGRVQVAYERLKLAKELSNTQREKLSRERVRLDKGRSTTAQVIMFEQEDIGARLGAIRAEADFRMAQAQLRLFEKGDIK